MINITIKKKHLYVLVAVLVSIAVAVPAISIAADRFTDVPESNVFHNDIAWLADNGITRGCNPPTNTRYCPDGNVTRGQMAAFMKRFHGRFISGPGADNHSPLALDWAERDGGTEPASTGSGIVDGMTMRLDIPWAGIVVVTASAEVANTGATDTLGCGINTGGDPSLAQGDSWRTIDLNTWSWYEVCATQTALPVGPGSRDVRLVLAGAQASTEVLSGSISAVLYPLDGTVPFAGGDPEDAQTPFRRSIVEREVVAPEG